MIEKGPGVDYLAEEHTIRHMRNEFFMPKLANRDKRETQQSGDDALARAAATVATIRKSKASSQLPAEIRSTVLEAFPHIRAASGA